MSNTPGTDHGQALPPGTRLEEFQIESVLGSGGFGITYLAHDIELGRKAVIKENLPAQFAWRETSTGTVRPRHTTGDDAEDFQWSLRNFMREAATLASLDHPGIVRVLRRFEANGTAYFVMPFVQGVAFDKLIDTYREKGRTFEEDELRGFLGSTLAALGYLHDRGIYHRDVKPGNILVTQEGEPVLIDFGSARQRLSDHSMTVVESAGYTPFEQSESRGNVGPWTDIYALGAVIRKAITFITPMPSSDRIRRDPLEPLASIAKLEGKYSPYFLASVDKAMRMNEEERWQSAEEWLQELFQPGAAAAVESFAPSDVAVAAAAVESAELAHTQPLSAPVPLSQDTPTSAGTSDPGIPSGDGAAAPVPGKGTKRSLLSFAVTMLTLMLCAGAVGAAWYLKNKGEQDKVVQTGGPKGQGKPAKDLFQLPQEESFDPFASPPPKFTIPERRDWAALATGGDAFAQALLAESSLNGLAGVNPETIAWMKKSADSGHPLGLFLAAEQERLKAGAGAAQDAMFRKAFEKGLLEDVDLGGPAWQAALGRAYLNGWGSARDLTQASSLLLAAAKQGHAWSQFLVGSFREKGEGLPYDPGAAASLYKKAAEGGWVPAQAATARMCIEGPESFRDPSGAFNWASKAAQAGYPAGFGLLGLCYKEGIGVEADEVQAAGWYGRGVSAGDPLAKRGMGRELMETEPERAFQLLSEAVAQGDRGASYWQGQMYEKGLGVASKDPIKALACYREGAKRNDGMALYTFGVFTEEGREMPADPDGAVPLYRKAVQQGIAEAGYRLGLLLSRNPKVKANPKEAAASFEMAARAGLPAASYEWGLCLEGGKGTERRPAQALEQYQKAMAGGVAEAGLRAGILLQGQNKLREAFSAYQKAADAGVPGAQVNLGLMLARGEGTKVDLEMALGWYQKASAAGDMDACMLLGMMYEMGLGTPVNRKEAIRCYAQASAKGVPEAKELLEKLSR